MDKSNQSNAIVDALLIRLFAAIGWIIGRAFMIPFQFPITVLWGILIFIMMGSSSAIDYIIISWMVITLIFGLFGAKITNRLSGVPYSISFFLTNFSVKFLPFISDNQRHANRRWAIQSGEMVRNLYFNAKLMSKDEYESGVMPPARVETSGGGNVVIYAERPITATIQTDTDRLTSIDAINHIGLPYALVDVDGNTINGGFTITYTANVLPELQEGNDILEEIKMVNVNQRKLYMVELHRNGGSDAFVDVMSHVGNYRKHEVAEKIATNAQLKSRFTAVYVKAEKFETVLSKDEILAGARREGVTPREYGENMRITFVSSVSPDTIEANDLLQEMGITRKDEFVDATIDRVEDPEWLKQPVSQRDEKDRYSEVRIILSQAIPGRPLDSLARQAQGFAKRLDARTVKGMIDSNGRQILRFIIKNDLDKPRIVKYENGIPSQNFNADNMSVVCASDEFGGSFTLTFGGNSGMVIGGQPGSGKTAGATSFLLPMALSEDVDLVVIDGKGGADWDAYKPVSSIFMSGADDHQELRAIAKVMKDAENEMIERVASNKAKLGDSNFWNASVEKRRKAGLPLKLIVVDECQELFTSKPGRDKDEFDKKMNDYVDEILTSSTKLIKRGRSAGIFVIFMTQKPTVDSLPSGIRDNCGQRIAFRLATGSAVAATLGSGNEEGMGSANPTQIPNARKGGAVIMNEDGTFKEVRFFYTPEADQERLISGSEKARKMRGVQNNPLIAVQHEIASKKTEGTLLEDKPNSGAARFSGARESFEERRAARLREREAMLNRNKAEPAKEEPKQEDKLFRAPRMSAQEMADKARAAKKGSNPEPTQPKNQFFKNPPRRAPRADANTKTFVDEDGNIHTIETKDDGTITGE